MEWHDRCRAQGMANMANRFFIRWTPAPGQGGYVTKRSPDRRPYVQHPADPDAKSWASRKNAERYLSLKDALWASHCAIVEAPSFWRRRDPQNDAEWAELAVFFGVVSGAALREQVRLADEVMEALVAE